MTFRNLLTNSIDSNGISASWEWYESQIDLMSEINVYGSNINSSSRYDTGIDNRQYALFQLKPELMNSNGKDIAFGYWLKNISSRTNFSYITGDGHSSNINSAASQRVRPRFLIG